MLYLILFVQLIILMVVVAKYDMLRRHILESKRIAVLEAKEKGEVAIDKVEEHLSDFDNRINQFRTEMNTPTYVTTAPELHPGVKNIPHNVVEDVPIRFKQEYAE